MILCHKCQSPLQLTSERLRCQNCKDKGVHIEFSLAPILDDGPSFYFNVNRLIRQSRKQVCILGTGFQITDQNRADATEFLWTLVRSAARHAVTRIDLSPRNDDYASWMDDLKKYLVGMPNATLLVPNPAQLRPPPFCPAICIIDGNDKVATAMLRYPDIQRPGGDGVGYAVLIAPEYSISSDYCRVLQDHFDKLSEACEPCEFTPNCKPAGHKLFLGYARHLHEPSVKLVARKAEALGTLVVAGMKLTYKRWRVRDGEPAATLSPDTAARVIGCVYSVSQEEFDRLKFYHGCTLGNQRGYRVCQLDEKFWRRQYCQPVHYFELEDATQLDTKPTWDEWKIVLQAARDLDLDATYIAELERTQLLDEDVSTPSLSDRKQRSAQLNEELVVAAVLKHHRYNHETNGFLNNPISSLRSLGRLAGQLANDSKKPVRPDAVKRVLSDLLLLDRKSTGQKVLDRHTDICSDDGKLRDWLKVLAERM